MFRKCLSWNLVLLSDVDKVKPILLAVFSCGLNIWLVESCTKKKKKTVHNISFGFNLETFFLFKLQLEDFFPVSSPSPTCKSFLTLHSDLCVWQSCFDRLLYGHTWDKRLRSICSYSNTNLPFFFFQSSCPVSVLISFIRTIYLRSHLSLHKVWKILLIRR